MSHADERAVFLRAHLTWEAGDFDGFMDLIAEDILYIVNVDGIQVPYALSAVGKDDVRARLQILLDTFVVTKFSIEKLEHEADHSRSLVHGIYRHKKTGEVLDIKLRFLAWVENGLITRMEEYHDALYVEAYERFVFHLQTTAQARGNGDNDKGDRTPVNRRSRPSPG